MPNGVMVVVVEVLHTILVHTKAPKSWAMGACHGLWVLVSCNPRCGQPPPPF